MYVFFNAGYDGENGFLSRRFLSWFYEDPLDLSKNGDGSYLIYMVFF